MWISIFAVVVALIVVAYFIAAASANPNTKYIGMPVSQTIFQQLTGVSDATLNAIGTPAGVSPPASIPGAPSGGKPVVTYIGGEFCPFCALERWSLIVALSRFGTFSGLQYMLSSSTDINANTPTFTFANATYTSSYIIFVGVEEFGRGGTGDVRQPLTTTQSSLVAQYDTCASTGQNGGIPFVDIANQYAVNCGSQFQLPGIAGGNWSQVASILNNPNNPDAQLIDGAANYLISAICKVDGGQPGSVCGQQYATATLSFPLPSVGAQSAALTIQTWPSEPRWTD